MKLWDIYVTTLPWNRIEVVFIGDTHIGQEAFHEGTLKLYLDYVMAAPNRFIILMGDMLEMATKHKSPGTASFEQNLAPQEQIDKFIELFSPVKNRILFVLSGNHEDRTKKTDEIDTMANLARELGIDNYVGYEGWLEIRLLYHNFLIYCHHGSGVSKYPHHGLNKVIYETTAGQQADVVAMAHIHQMYDADFPIIRRRRMRLFIDTILGIRTGHCLNYAGYAKAAMMRPSPMGFTILRFTSTQFNRQIDVARGLEKITWR